MISEYLLAAVYLGSSLIDEYDKDKIFQSQLSLV